MISNINLLSTILEISKDNSAGCSCKSSGTEFNKIIDNLLNSDYKSYLDSARDNYSDVGMDMAMLSLLKAVSKQKLYTLSSTNNQNNKELNSVTQIENIKTEEVEIENSTDKYSDIDYRINNAISISAKKYGIDENLIKAIIKVESNFNVNAKSSAGAKGLMQIMPSNYNHLGITDPFNIEQNINGGTKLLKEYIDKYDGNVKMALMAYNGGPGRMKNRGVKSEDDLYKMPKETQNYVSKVMKYYGV